MADIPLIQHVLGEKFERLEGPVKTHFSLKPDDPARIVLQGHMDQVWHPGWLTLPMWGASFIGVLFPETGRHVPVTITIEAQGLRQQWHRTFEFGQRRRGFSDAMVYDPVENRILNFFGTGDRFAMVFHFGTLPNGGIEIIGGQNFVNLGSTRLAAPRLMTPGMVVQEWPIGDDTIQMKFSMRHPALGKLYQYNGRFVVKKEHNGV
jgi:hypothetical protein